MAAPPDAKEAAPAAFEGQGSGPRHFGPGFCNQDYPRHTALRVWAQPARGERPVPRFGSCSPSPVDAPMQVDTARVAGADDSVRSSGNRNALPAAV
jgi:hypothetical protein